MENDQQRQIAQSNYMLTKQRQDEKRKVQEAIYLSKREEAKQTKMVRSQNEQKKRHMEFKMEQENRMKNQIVNQQKRLAQMKVSEDYRRKVDNVRKNHNDKVLTEDETRAHKEMEVMQMEKLEMELIKKLQTTQAL